MQETVQVLGRVFFRAYVVAMLILIFDNKAFYGLPLGLLVGMLSEFKNMIEFNKNDKKNYIQSGEEELKKESKKWGDNDNRSDNWSDKAALEITKLDYETLRHQVEHSLRVGKDMNYGNYNIAGLILSDLRLYIEKNSGKHEVSDEMRKFSEEYAVWLISNEQKYINAMSPDFTKENNMDIFIRECWMNRMNK